jgi:hypothetical protein
LRWIKNRRRVLPLCIRAWRWRQGRSQRAVRRLGGVRALAIDLDVEPAPGRKPGGSENRGGRGIRSQVTCESSRRPYPGAGRTRLDHTTARLGTLLQTATALIAGGKAEVWGLKLDSFGGLLAMTLKCDRLDRSRLRRQASTKLAPPPRAPNRSRSAPSAISATMRDPPGPSG